MPIQEQQPHLPGATFEFTMWEGILGTQGNLFVINYTVTCSFLYPDLLYPEFSSTLSVTACKAVIQEHLFS